MFQSSIFSTLSELQQCVTFQLVINRGYPATAIIRGRSGIPCHRDHFSLLPLPTPRSQMDRKNKTWRSRKSHHVIAFLVQQLESRAASNCGILTFLAQFKKYPPPTNNKLPFSSRPEKKNKRVFPKIGKPPKWMVKIMVPNPIKIHDLGGKKP